MTAIYLVGALLTAIAVPLLFTRRYPGNRSWLWVGILAGLVGMLLWPVTLWLTLAVWFLGFAEPRQDASTATRLPRKIVLPVSAVGSLATLVAIGATAEPVAASSSEPARLVASAPRPTPTLVVPSTTATTASTSPPTPPASTTPPPTRVAKPSPTPGPAPRPLLKPAPKPQPQPRPQPKPEPKEQPEPQPKPQPKATTKASDGGSVYYANCAAVIAAGKAPIRSGDPGYRPALDRDGDGQGCAGD